MIRYPLWKYIIIIIATIVGLIYSIPNLYGNSPAIQISRVDHKVIDSNVLSNIYDELKKNNLFPNGEILDENFLKIKFYDVDSQLKAKDILQNYLDNNYIIALNLVSNSPAVFQNFNALPMFLGLDLRGGVYFLLSVDINGAIKKTLEKYKTDIKRQLRNSFIRYDNLELINNEIVIKFANNNYLNDAYNNLSANIAGLNIIKQNLSIVMNIPNSQIDAIKEASIKQNIVTLHNRINELGVAEPIIQRQGSDRIVVELPGVQDTARAKDILGRTASLEIRMVDDNQDNIINAQKGIIPPNLELLNEKDSLGNTKPILVNKEVELTGDNIIDASPSFDENGQPAVDIRLNSIGANIFKQVTGANIGKRMAMILIDNAKSEVITAPTIKNEIGGGRVQISGAMNVSTANDIALLLKSGSLATSMTYLEERNIGPSLGAENIQKGIHSVLWGFLLIAIFMIIYYQVFGIISIVSLGINLLLLIAVLSMLQATLTLPGIAAIALTLGMAIDSNVLINERIREELRLNKKPAIAIIEGYKHAFTTIFDSNITTLIAGLALLAFGSGPIKGFAIVHCLGILTSMFSAVFVSRGVVGLIYNKHKINKLYI